MAMTKNFNQNIKNYSGMQTNIQNSIESVIININTEIESTMLSWFNNFIKNRTTVLKISDAYFSEKKVDYKRAIPISGARITPEDREEPGKFSSSLEYSYGELGSIFFSVASKFRKIRSVNIMYSSCDDFETLSGIDDFKRSLQFKRLKKGSRQGDIRFNSECELIYRSKKEVMVKNFLVCVDTVKKGFDLFIIQTVQSPVLESYTDYEIGDEGVIKSYKINAKINEFPFKMQSRVILLDEIDKMFNPFNLKDGRLIEPAKETEMFVDFVKEFKSAYNLRVIEFKE